MLQSIICDCFAVPPADAPAVDIPATFVVREDGEDSPYFCVQNVKAGGGRVRGTLIAQARTKVKQAHSIAWRGRCFPRAIPFRPWKTLKC